MVEEAWRVRRPMHPADATGQCFSHFHIIRGSTEIGIECLGAGTRRVLCQLLQAQRESSWCWGLFVVAPDPRFLSVKQIAKQSVAGHWQASKHYEKIDAIWWMKAPAAPDFALHSGSQLSHRLCWFWWDRCIVVGGVRSNRYLSESWTLAVGNEKSFLKWSPVQVIAKIEKAKERDQRENIGRSLVARGAVLLEHVSSLVWITRTEGHWKQVKKRSLTRSELGLGPMREWAERCLCQAHVGMMNVSRMSESTPKKRKSKSN